MLMEVFVHIAHLSDLRKGRIINCKVNYASQFDVRLFINPKKYVIYANGRSENANLIQLRKKTLIDYLGLRKFFK